MRRKDKERDAAFAWQVLRDAAYSVLAMTDADGTPVLANFPCRMNLSVCSAIWDIVTDASPCWATRAAVVSRVASRTARRCASIVSSHSLGTPPLYATTIARHSDLTET